MDHEGNSNLEDPEFENWESRILMTHQVKKCLALESVITTNLSRPLTFFHAIKLVIKNNVMIKLLLVSPFMS